MVGITVQPAGEEAPRSGMRLYSTPQSAVNGEVTKLAIVECFLSVALYVGIEIYLGTFRHLAIAVATAPLMLLRTDDSAKWGMSLFRKYLGRLTDGKVTGSPLRILLETVFTVVGGASIPLVAIAIRVLSTLGYAFRYPLAALASVPQNWVRQSLCTDFKHPPELLPLENAYGFPDDLSFAETKESFLNPFQGNDRTVRGWFIAIVFAGPLLVVGYLPSALYRITFKATALAYAPFVWVAHSTLANQLSAKDRLERITKGEFEKTRRYLALLVVGMVLTKLLFVYGWVDLDYIRTKVPSERLIEQVLVPSGWPWWQQILVVDALLTFFLLWFADAALPRLTSEYGWRERFVLDTTSTTSFVRATLSLIEVGYVGYLAMADTAVRFLHRFV